MALAIGVASTASAAGQGPIDPRDLGRTATLTFAEEFDSLNLRRGGVGRWDTAFPWAAGRNGSTLAGNAEKQWYIDAEHGPTRAVKPWSVDKGILSLTARRTDPALKDRVERYAYTSGLLTTHSTFRQTYGYFEMRARMPAGKGLWPAFWLLQPDGKWPPEIDVVEILGHQPSTLHTALHFSQDGRKRLASKSIGVGDTSSGWHTYGVRWDPEKIAWFFDGDLVHETGTPADLHEPMYLLINLAVGGVAPGDPDASTPFPSSLLVDYVRAYKAR